MSKELTKEEILSKRIGTYGFTKLELSKPIICPIEALDAMKEYSGQNTKLLIDEIAELKKQVEYQKSGYVTLKEYLKTDDILGAIIKIKSDLKAAESVNEQRIGELQNFASLVVNSYKLITDTTRPVDVLHSLQVKAGEVLTRSNQNK